MDYGSSVLDLKRKIKRQTKRTPTIAKAHPTIQSTPQPLPKHTPTINQH
jgi:hypothetical protein